MNFLNKLERKIGRFAIPNLMFMIIVGQFTVFAASMLFPQLNIQGFLSLDKNAIFEGQVWRLLSFIFIPPPSGIIFMIFSLYFYYLIGTSLENQWGSFKFNIYYLTGMIGIILASFITGNGTNIFLNYSLFFAFAVFYPEFQVNLFFILPIKIKYLALLDALFFVYSFIIGGWVIRLSIIASLLNFILFFGGDFIKFIKQQASYQKTRRNFRKSMREK